MSKARCTHPKALSSKPFYTYNMTLDFKWNSKMSTENLVELWNDEINNLHLAFNQCVSILPLSNNKYKTHIKPTNLNF